jgi:putative DNA primase/helicase
MAARSDSPSVLIEALDRTSIEAWQVLLAANSHTDAREFLCRYADIPSRLEINDRGDLVPKPLTPDRLKHRLCEIAWWLKKNRDGTATRQNAVPNEVVTNVLAEPNPPLPILLRIVRVPVIGADGSIHDTPGFSENHGVFYEPTRGLTIPKIRELPSARDITKARRLFVDDLFGDFPFTSDADRAHAFCLAVQPFVRGLIDGHTPMFGTEAPRRGSGKTLLVNAALWPAVGREIEKRQIIADENEMRKQITAALRGSPIAIAYDNVGIAIDSSSLATALTTAFWNDRDLGFSREISLPNLATWVYTANNTKLSTEIARRTVRIRIDSGMEFPEDRNTWRHDPLLAWVEAERGQLVWAALTLIRAWVADGRPAGEQSMEDFKPWSNVMGGVCKVAGIDGFLDNRSEFRDQADYQRDEVYEALAAWHQIFNGREVQAKDVAAHTEIVTGFGVDPYGRKVSTELGRALGSFADCVYRDLMLRRAGQTGGSWRWVVVQSKTRPSAQRRRGTGRRPT